MREWVCGQTRSGHPSRTVEGFYLVVISDPKSFRLPLAILAGRWDGLTRTGSKADASPARLVPGPFNDYELTFGI